MYSTMMFCVLTIEYILFSININFIQLYLYSVFTTASIIYRIVCYCPVTRHTRLNQLQPTVLKVAYSLNCNDVNLLNFNDIFLRIFLFANIFFESSSRICYQLYDLPRIQDINLNCTIYLHVIRGFGNISLASHSLIIHIRCSFFIFV